MSEKNELAEQSIATFLQHCEDEWLYTVEIAIAAFLKCETVADTPTEHLIIWVKNNPVPGLSPKESQMITWILLWLIHAPRDLLLLTEVLKNISASVDTVFAFFDNEKDSITLSQDLNVNINEILRTANHLIENEEDLIIKKIITIIETEDDKHPMRGRLSEYPIYSMLMNSSHNEDESFLCLQGLIFLANASLATLKTTPFLYFNSNPDTFRIRKHHSSIQQAALFVRQYSIGDIDDASLEALEDLEGLGDLNSFHSDVTEREDDRQGEEREQYKSALSPILKKWLDKEYRSSLGDSKKKRRNNSRRRSLGWHDGFIRFGSGLIQESTAQDPEESYGELREGFKTDIQVITAQASVAEGEEHLVREQREADLDLAENAVEAELLIAEDTSDQSTGRLIIGNQIAHIIRANQLLSTNWSQATLWEITALLKLCHKILDPKTVYSYSKAMKEAAVIALLMLWTGKSLKSVISGFRWVEGVSPNSVPISYVYKTNPANCYLRIRSVNASAKLKPSATQLQYLHSRNEFLNLPDLVGLGGYLAQILPKDMSKKGSYKLFKQKVATYRKVLNLLLKKLPPGHRINEHKITMFLFHQIASKTSGDVADAVLITGTYHSIAQTLMHYTSPTLVRQKALYIKTVNKIVSDVAAEGFNLDTANYLDKSPSYELFTKGVLGLLTMPFVKQPPKNEVIGSHFLPLKTAIIQLVETLKEQIKQAPDNTNLEAIQQYHNHFSLYTILMMGYATGYRAVKDPYLLKDAIDPTTNLAVISDKDGPEMYNSRLVWVPETIQKQLEHYQKHYQRLLPTLQHMDQQVYNFTSQASLPALFLLDPDLKWELVRPKTMKPLLQNNLPLPINVNRRYLRTRLRAGGCPTEVVDAFMGHWGRGQEYWGEYSSLSVIDLLETLKPHITAIQEELGFEVLASQYR